MKKTLLTFTLLALVMVTYGQTFDLGVKASYNTTKFTLSASSVANEFKNGSGVNFGVFARLGGSKVYLQPEFLYSSKTGTYTVKNTLGAVLSTNDVKMQTIQIPILLGFKLLDLKIASLRAFTGPAASFVTNGSMKNIGTQVKDNFTSNNMGWDWQVGAGVDVLMFTLDMRYELPLSELKSATVDTFKGRTFTVSIGLKFI
jgi:Flp pilus assembly pilin Flp